MIKAMGMTIGNVGIGKAEGVECEPPLIREAALNLSEPDLAANYDLFKNEHLSVIRLEDDSSVRQAAALLKSLNPKSIALDIETTSKDGNLGAVNGAFNGAIRLIQLGVKTENHEFQLIIDCHSANPAALLPVLRSPRIEKQIHYSNFEQAWLRTHCGVELKNVYDTCIADREIQKSLYEILTEAGLEAGRSRYQELNPENSKPWTPYIQRYKDAEPDRQARAAMEAAGLAAAQALVPGWEPGPSRLQDLVRRHLEMEIPKEDQISDWGRKDLLGNQIVYAAMDVALLSEITRQVKAEAKLLGLEEEIREKTEKACQGIVNRADGYAKKFPDDQERVVRALKRSRTKQEIDRIQDASWQMTLTAESRRMVKTVASELRSGLKK